MTLVAELWVTAGGRRPAQEVRVTWDTAAGNRIWMGLLERSTWTLTNRVIGDIRE